MLDMEVDEFTRGVEPLRKDILQEENLENAYVELRQQSEQLAATRLNLPSTHRTLRALSGFGGSKPQGLTLKDIAETEGDKTFNEFLDWIIGEPSRVKAVVNEAPIPYDDIERDAWWEQFWIDHSGGREMSVEYAELPKDEPFKLFGREINSRFGLGAANFAGCSAFIAAHANCGFDICTTRTYHLNRPGDAGHSHPRVIPVPVSELDSATITIPSVVHADRLRLFDSSRRDEDWAVLHSIGAPGSPLISIGNNISRLARTMLHRQNQVLIASIYDEQLDDWALLAKTVASCGADAIELNFSLPTRQLGMIAQDGDETRTGPQKSRTIIETVQRALAEIGKPGFPVVAKLGYMEESSLAAWFENCHDGLAGVTAINAVQTTALDTSDGQAMFESDEGEPNKSSLVGESGDRLSSLAREMVERLVELRGRHGRSANDFTIIANGGVRSADDHIELRELGADVVQSCSAAYRDRLLARTVRNAAVGELGNGGVYFAGKFGDKKTETQRTTNSDLTGKLVETRRSKYVRAFSSMGLSLFEDRPTLSEDE